MSLTLTECKVLYYSLVNIGGVWFRLELTMHLPCVLKLTNAHVLCCRLKLVHRDNYEFVDNYSKIDSFVTFKTSLMTPKSLCYLHHCRLFIQYVIVCVIMIMRCGYVVGTLCLLPVSCHEHVPLIHDIL